MCMGDFGKKVAPGSLVDGDRSKPPGAEGPGDRGSSGHNIGLGNVRLQSMLLPICK